MADQHTNPVWVPVTLTSRLRPWEVRTFGGASPAQIERLRALGSQGDPLPLDYLTSAQAGVLLGRYTRGEPLWQPSGRDDDNTGSIIRPAPRQGRLF